MTPAVAKVGVFAGLTLLAFGVLAHWRSDVRAEGVVAEQRRVADSTAAVKDSVARARDIAAAAAVQDAERAAAAAEAKAQAATRQQAHTDSAARAAGTERDVAQRILADSSARIGVVRGELDRLITATRADSTAAAAQRAADRRTIAGKDSALAAYAVAAARSTDAIDAQVAARVAAQRQTTLADRAAPSFLARHLSITLGYGAVSSAGEVRTGFGVVAGWKVLP